MNCDQSREAKMQQVAIRSERALVPSQAGAQWEDAGLFVVAVGSDVYFYRSSGEGEARGVEKGSGGFSLAAVVKDVLSPTSLRTRGAAGQRKIHVHGLVPWRNLLFVYGGSKLIVINHLLETTRLPCDVGVALKGEWIVHVSLAPGKSTDQAEDFQTRLSILTAGSRLLTFQMEYAPYGDERQRKFAICDFLLVKEEEVLENGAICYAGAVCHAGNSGSGKKEQGEDAGAAPCVLFGGPSGVLQMQASPNTDDQSPGLRDGATAALRPRRQMLGTHPNAAILDVRAVSWDSETAERSQEVVVLSASDDRTVRIWCRAGMSLEGTLEGHGGKVTCVDALPFRVKGGHYALLVLSASEDRTVRLWLHLHGPGNSSSPALKLVCLQTFEANGALRWCSFGLLGKLENVLWKSDDDEDAAVTRTDRTSLKVWAGGDGGVVVFPVDASTIRRGLRTWGAEMQMGTIISDEEQRNEQLDVASLEEEILLPVGGGEVHIRDLCRVRYTPSAVAGDPPLQNQKRVSLFVAPSRAKAEGSQEVRFMSFSVENERLAVSSGGVLERRVEIPNGMEILVLCDATAATSWREEGDSGVGSALPCFWGGTACGSLVFGFVNPAGEERGMCERVAEPQVGQGASAQRVVLLKLVKQTRERSVLVLCTPSQVFVFAVPTRVEATSQMPEPRLLWASHASKVQCCCGLYAEESDSLFALAFGDNQGRIRIFGLDRGETIAEAKAGSKLNKGILSINCCAQLPATHKPAESPSTRDHVTGTISAVFRTTGGDSSVRKWRVQAGNQQCHQAAQLRKIEDHKVHNVAHVYHFSDATSRVAGFKAGSFVLAAEFGAKPLLKSCIGGADRPLEIQDDFLVYGKRGQRKWRGEEKMMSVVVVQKMPRADDHSSEVAGNTKEELLDLGGTDGNEVLAVALGMSVSTKADNGEPLPLAFYGGEGNELIVHGAVADHPSFQRVYRDASAVKSIFYEETLNVLLVVNAHGHVLVFDASGPHFPLQASLQNSIADEGERLVAIAAAPMVTRSALDKPQVRHSLSKNAQRILFWVACTAGGGLETGHYVHNVEVEDHDSMRDDVGVNASRSLTGLSKTPGPPVSLGPGGFGTSVAVVSTLPLTHLVAVGSTSGLIHLYRHEAGFTVTLHRFGVSLPLLGAGEAYSNTDMSRFRRTDNGEAVLPGEVNSICAVGDSSTGSRSILFAAACSDGYAYMIDVNRSGRSTPRSGISCGPCCPGDATARAAAKMNAVCYDPARKLLLAAAWDQTIRAFRIEQEQDHGPSFEQVGVGYTSVSELQSMAVDPGGSGKVIVGGRGLEWFSVDEVCDGGISHFTRVTQAAAASARLGGG